MYTLTIDWLSFTLKQDTKEARNVLQMLNRSGIMEPVPAHFGYDRAAKTEHGAVIYSSESNSRMGVHVVISGSSITQYSECGTGIREILHAAIIAQAKITRLDMAKDAQDERFQWIAIEEAATGGNYRGTAQKIASIRSSDGGSTLYIGSRQSEKFVRVYNKGIESGQGGDWWRLEMETKGEVANAVARVIDAGTTDFNSLLCSQVKRMCDMENESWKNLLTADASFSLPKIEKQTDREKWINEQVAQAVLSHLEQNPQSDAVRRLFEMLEKHYRLGSTDAG